MKNTYVLWSLAGILIAGVVACNNGGSSNQAQRPTVPPPPGTRAGQSQAVSKNGAPIDSAADDIELKGNPTSYDPTDRTHVINSNVKPNQTGYTANDTYLFVDGSNDRLMETLRARLDNGTRVGTIQDKTVDPTNFDNLKEGNLALARAITMAEMRRSEDGTFEFHIWIQTDQEIVLKSPYMEDLENTNKSKKFPLEAEDSTDEAYKLSTAQCLAREVKEKACQTVLLRLVKNGNEANIVFRRLPAKVELGEYSARLLATYHNDNIIDRWVEFFYDAKTYPLRKSGSFKDPISVAELKSFAVVNGIAAFSLEINGYRGKFIVSGDMVTSLRNSSEKLNIPLQKGVLAGTEDQTIDYISESVTDARILHANGRGMMEIAVQLTGGANASNNVNSDDEGGIIYNKQGLARSGKNSAELFQENMRIRFNFATRTKSLRLQEKSNRAIRFTVVPVISNVIDPDLK